MLGINDMLLSYIYSSIAFFPPKTLTVNIRLENYSRVFYWMQCFVPILNNPRKRNQSIHHHKMK